MKVLTVVSYKGGVGKSTAAIHLAAFLAAHGETVLIDGDPNRTAIAWAARGSLSFAVQDEAEARLDANKVAFAVIDTAARPDAQDLVNVAQLTDLFILPTSPDVVSLQPMIATANAVKDLGIPYRALVNLVPPRPSREGETMRDDLRAVGVPVFETLIRRSASYAKAALQGVTVNHLADTRARGVWSDYESLGKEILSLWHKQNKAAGSFKG